MKRMGFTCCMSPQFLLTAVPRLGSTCSSPIPATASPIPPALRTDLFAMHPVETRAKADQTENFEDGKIVLSGIKETTWIGRTGRSERTLWV
jgi:hypothetical protein